MGISFCVIDIERFICRDPAPAPPYQGRGVRLPYAQRLLERRDTFREVTGTNKSLQLTMVTSSGLVHNAGWQSINNEVDVDALFHA